MHIINSTQRHQPIGWPGAAALTNQTAGRTNTPVFRSTASTRDLALLWSVQCCQSNRTFCTFNNAQNWCSRVHYTPPTNQTFIKIKPVAKDFTSRHYCPLWLQFSGSCRRHHCDYILQAKPLQAQAVASKAYKLGSLGELMHTRFFQNQRTQNEYAVFVFSRPYFFHVLISFNVEDCTCMRQIWFTYVALKGS